MKEMTQEEIDETRLMADFEKGVADCTIIALYEGTMTHRIARWRVQVKAFFAHLNRETEPVIFRQANGTLNGNRTTKDLPVCRTEENFTVSCWKIPFWKRVKLLANGRVWLVVKGPTHPPLWIDTEVVWG